MHVYIARYIYNIVAVVAKRRLLTVQIVSSIDFQFHTWLTSLFGTKNILGILTACHGCIFNAHCSDRAEQIFNKIFKLRIRRWWPRSRHIQLGRPYPSLSFQSTLLWPTPRIHFNKRGATIWGMTPLENFIRSRKCDEDRKFLFDFIE